MYIVGTQKIKIYRRLFFLFGLMLYIPLNSFSAIFFSFWVEPFLSVLLARGQNTEPPLSLKLVTFQSQV